MCFKNVFVSYCKKLLILLINYKLFESVTNSAAFVSSQTPWKILAVTGKMAHGLREYTTHTENLSSS